LIEVGFVDDLFEMYKLREAIAKAKAEILSHKLMSSYTHRFCTALFTSNITFRSSSIENIIMDKRIELDKEKKIEASLLIYDYLTLKIPDGPDSGPVDPIRVHDSCTYFEKMLGTIGYESGSNMGVFRFLTS